MNGTFASRSESVVNVVAQIERRRRIALAENFLQALGMRLFLCVVHSDDGAEIFRGRPALEREGKFLARAPGEEIQLEALRPFFNLPRRHDQFFVSNVSGLAVAAPIEFLERRARFFVRSGVPERTYPRGNHAPVVVKTGLALPAMQLGIRDALAGNMAHCLQRRA